MQTDHWGYAKRDDDYVLVVRCKDCKYTNARTSDGKNVHCGMFVRWIGNEFFCAYGRRGTDEID